MNWIVLLIIYVIVCILAVICIRRRLKNDDFNKEDIINWILLILIAPLAILFSPILITFTIVSNIKRKRQRSKQEKEHKRRQEELLARTIIGGSESTVDGIEALSTYKCQECGFTLRSEPQGFFKLASGVYFNFKCKNCNNIVSISSDDIHKMYYFPHCPVCEEPHDLSFWNPVEGKCPKCDGVMEKER